MGQAVRRRPAVPVPSSGRGWPTRVFSGPKGTPGGNAPFGRVPPDRPTAVPRAVVLPPGARPLGIRPSLGEAGITRSLRTPSFRSGGSRDGPDGPGGHRSADGRARSGRSLGGAPAPSARPAHPGPRWSPVQEADRSDEPINATRGKTFLPCAIEGMNGGVLPDPLLLLIASRGGTGPGETAWTTGRAPTTFPPVAPPMHRPHDEVGERNRARGLE